MRPRLVVVAALCATALSCILIVDPDVKPDPPKNPNVIPVPFPTPDGQPLRVAELWLVPVDPGTTTLASSYNALKLQVDSTLQGNGATLAGQVVVGLHDQRRLWASPGFDGGAAPVGFEDMLRYYAAATDGGDFHDPCSSYTLAALGHDVADIHVTFPEDLVPRPVVEDAGSDAGESVDGGFVPAHDAGPDASVPGDPFLAPLAQGFDALLVIFVDSGPRPYPYESCGMSGQTVGNYFTRGNPLIWLRQGNRGFPPTSVAFAFVATPEDAGFSAMRRECLTHTAFPKAALDVIAPSTVAYYSPWTAEASQAASPTRYFPFCEAVAGDWQFGEFVNQWARAMTPGGAPP